MALVFSEANVAVEEFSVATEAMPQKDKVS